MKVRPDCGVRHGKDASAILDCYWPDSLDTRVARAQLFTICALVELASAKERWVVYPEHGMFLAGGDRQMGSIVIELATDAECQDDRAVGVLGKVCHRIGRK